MQEAAGWLYMKNHNDQCSLAMDRTSDPAEERNSYAEVAADSTQDVYIRTEQHDHNEISAQHLDALPTLHSLLGHAEQPGSGQHSRSQAHKGPTKQQHSSGDPSLAAAVGGLLALTGSVLYHTIARAKHGKRVRNLKEGLQAKEQALAATQKELQHAKKQLVSLQAAADRRQSLEAELAASRANLEAMTQELEAARAAARRIENDMTSFHDQLQSVTSTKQQQIADAVAAADRRIAEADQARQEAEERWKRAYHDLDAAQTELETVKGELGLRGSQLEGLTRELEFTRRQLVEAEKRVERAQMESRSARAGYGAADYDSWD